MNKDQIIARQSSLKAVLEYLTLVNVPIGLSETIGITEVVTDYILNGRTENVKTTLKAFDNYIKTSAVDDMVEKLTFDLNGH